MGKVLIYSNTSGPIVRERPAAAAAAILEGMLLEKTPGADTWRKHSTQGGTAEPIFAKEDVASNKDTEVTPYADGENVPAYIRPPIASAWLLDGQVVADGDPLESNGDGTLIKHVAVDEGLLIIHGRIVGFADESLSPSGANVRIKVRSA